MSAAGTIVVALLMLFLLFIIIYCIVMLCVLCCVAMAEAGRHPHPPPHPHYPHPEIQRDHHYYGQYYQYWIEIIITMYSIISIDWLPDRSSATIFKAKIAWRLARRFEAATSSIIALSWYWVLLYLNWDASTSEVSRAELRGQNKFLLLAQSILLLQTVFIKKEVECSCDYEKDQK